ncbi:MAG TPA: hypothetical protein VN842_01445 [Thermoplasmata archaeon]|nr:hypothetical protein [Thermoplasmata archaeon]
MDNVNEIAQYLDASAWLGVGALGVLLFLLGIYQPALASLPYSAYLRVVVAVAGGAVAVMGFSFWYDRREYERRHPVRPPVGPRAREIEIAPSLEVYDPKLALDVPVTHATDVPDAPHEP